MKLPLLGVSLWKEFLLTRCDISWFRFQGQSELSYYTPSDFQMAIEEAFLAERGFTEKLIADINTAATNNGYDDSILKPFQEVSGSNFTCRISFSEPGKSTTVLLFLLLPTIWGTA